MSDYEVYKQIYGDLIYDVEFYADKTPQCVLLKQYNDILDRLPE